MLALQLVTAVGAASRMPARDVAPFPPMMWHSWGLFTWENLVNESNMLEMAHALVSSGMAEAGYDTVNVVCNGWLARDPVTGEMQENRTLWPSGMQGFATRLHAMKPPLKLGCYTAPQTTNCMCGTGPLHSPIDPTKCEQGCLGHEAVDMAFFARIGCDHVMVDMPAGSATAANYRERYAAIGAAIAKSTNPDMLFGVWSGGLAKAWKWASDVGGHYWRTGTDIYDSWVSVLRMWDTTYSIPGIDRYTKPGQYSFLDQLIVGDVPGRRGSAYGPGLSLNETVAHITMWIMAASPLLTCIDVRNMTADTKAILMNPEVLAVHKDPLALMATRIDVGGGRHELHSSNLCAADFPACQEHPGDAGYPGHQCRECRSNWSVFEKRLHDNSSAVMALNRGESPLAVDIQLMDLGDSMYETYEARDLWERSDVGVFTAAMNVMVPGHGVRFFRMRPHSPAPRPAPPPPPPAPALSCPEGYSAHERGLWSNPEPCGHYPDINCTTSDKDTVNVTVSQCAKKCELTEDCVAFEIWQQAPKACFIFIHVLQAPFHPVPECFTCVRTKTSSSGAAAAGLTLGNGTFLLEGKPFRIFGGSLQHFRTPTAHWEHRLDLLVAMGLNAVQTLVPWFLMEPQPGEFVTTGAVDIVRFAKLCDARGLKLVLRPGPFICDGPDLGGIPWFLGDTRTRSADPIFLDAVRSFYTKFFALLREHDLTAGQVCDKCVQTSGPIIMAQIDNEYGIFGADKQYLTFVRDLWRQGLGEGVVIYSTDPANGQTLGGSRLDGVLQTIDENSLSTAADFAHNFQTLRASQQLSASSSSPVTMLQPLMDSEFYPGSLNYWGDNQFPNAYNDSAVSSALDKLLSTRLAGSAPPSFTLWLFNSQTDFGFWGGSLWFGEVMKWFVPSYDFGAPVDEAGVVRPLFHMLREVLRKHGAKVPSTPLPASPPVRDYGVVLMNESLSLFDALPVLAPHPVQSPTVLTMEEMSQGYGYALYSTWIPLWLPQKGGSIEIAGMRDRASIYLSKQLHQVCTRGGAVDTVNCAPAPTPTPHTNMSCPTGFAAHASGFWTNLQPCNACPHDTVNNTVALCASKCEKTPDCKAFELYRGPSDPSGTCFIFVHELQLPFTSNDDCLTCVSSIMNAGSAAHLAIETPLAAATNKGSDTFAVATGGDGGVALDILVENLGRVTGNPIGMDFTFRGIRRWVNVAGQQLANWTIAPLPLSNVSALGQSFRWRKSAASTAKDGIPRFYRGRFSVLPGELADTFVTLPGWGKGQIFVNGHNVQRYWSSLGPQYSFYCPAQWLVEGENELVLFETSRAAANFTVSLRANHTIVR